MWEKDININEVREIRTRKSFSNRATNSCSDLSVQKFALSAKGRKIMMSVVILVIVVAIIVLYILLNNPIKKVEDHLISYYQHYNDNDKKALVEIDKVLSSNQDNENILNQIENLVHKDIDNWVKNFNTTYDTVEKLDDAYQKIRGVLRDLYSHFNGVSYIIDNDLYNKYLEELSDLYHSKNAYLLGKSNEDKDIIYSYYIRVIESDVYYKEVTTFIKEYSEEEIKHIENETRKMLKTEGTNEERLENYYEIYAYLKEHEISNQVSLKETEEYQAIQ